MCSLVSRTFHCLNYFHAISNKIPRLNLRKYNMGLSIISCLDSILLTNRNEFYIFLIYF
jgi:hypothetical protein